MNPRLKKTIFWSFFSLLLAGLLFFNLYRFLKPPAGFTNFLILGVAGENHSGSDLTDSLIFVSVENQTGETLMLSLPRDIWIEPLRTKLNSVYHYQGMEGTKKAVSEILGQEIDHTVLLDFNVFTQVVDYLDGVEVEVERTFDDNNYPIAGKEDDLCDGDKEYRCRYEHIHFEVGKTWMDGATALKYVRSRNAEGEEGTDFARSQRQQRLLLGIKQKILTPKFLLQPKKTIGLVKLVTNNIQTDIRPDLYLNLFKIALKVKGSKIESLVLNDGHLINPTNNKQKYDNQWVLVPATGDWSEIQQYVSSLIKN